MAELNKDEIRALRAEIETLAGTQTKYAESVKELAQGYGDAYKAARNINFIEKQISVTKAKIQKLEKSSSAEDKKTLKILEKINKENEHKLQLYKLQNEALTKQQLSLTNIATAVTGTILKGVKATWREFDKWDKSARTTAIQMGLTGKHVDGFRRSLDVVVKQTGMIGVNYADLAKIQGKYTDQMGRATMLSTKALTGISSMSVALGVGAEEAASMAGDFFLLTASAESVADIVEDTMNKSSSMGVHAVKVTRIMNQNLKIAQRYNFRDGTKNLMNMAAMTAKFRLEISQVAAMADKLFEPEGAVEMAANLQVLGGEFSKLADPFRLMFMARNDMEGLQDAIINSTKGLVTFNRESGKLNLSAQELHRLKYIAQATGMDLDNLVETARSFAQVDLARQEIGFNVDEKYHDFISSAAQWSKDKKTWVIDIVDKDGTKTQHAINQLSNDIAKQAYQENENLKKRAEQSQTFMDMLNNLWMQVQSAFLPALRIFADAFRDPVKKLAEALKEEGGPIDKILEFSKKLYHFLDKWTEKSLVEQMAIGGLIAGAIGAIPWIMHGMALGTGFNMVAGLGGGGLGGGAMTGMFGGGRHSASDRSFARRQIFAKGNTMRDRAGYARIGMGGKMGRLGAGLGFGAAAYGVDALRESQLEKGNIQAHGGWDMAGQIGSAALQGAAYGSMLGPKGMAVGALIGGAYGSVTASANKRKFEEAQRQAKLGTFGSIPVNDMANDFIVNKQGITPFSKDDTVVGAKPGGPIDKMLGAGNQISFKPLKIEFGNINLTVNGKDLDIIDFERNPKFVADLSRVIQEKIQENINGGKLSATVA